ncbi:phosphate ABC transporter permease subunit PstC [Gimibacter soli]|uniref:Phosphate transport system permease protein n=1 Tax=Gimibacter soli TaxID=3024400 RepID=A0AAE9XTG2_9PROT|nr:phosphate ABC transporter permease subunit PstC [Gimibacter soli]WCL53013.1 phosphate ABC transporter permease subunit PstC [Gimibacter soli]
MTSSAISVIILLLSLAAFAAGRQRSLATVGGRRGDLHSLPRHYGYFAASLVVLPATLILVLWLTFGDFALERMTLNSIPEGAAVTEGIEDHLVLNRIRIAVDQGDRVEKDPTILAAAKFYREAHGEAVWLTFAAALLAGLAGLAYALKVTSAEFRARNKVETFMRVALIACSALAVLTTVGIVASLLFESLRFFQQVPISEFLFGLKWSPQTALRADQVGSSGAFGAVPLFAGTLLISLLAMLVAGPIGLLAAIYLTQYASGRVRAVAKPALEILAGVPTVVYGFFAALTIAPLFREMGLSVGLDIASESALAAGVVMGIMIIPFVSSLSDDAITAVPRSLSDGSLALGATPSETIRKVILPAALPGIVGAFLLAVSRAVGETMIVVMAAGMQPNLTANPFEAVTTVTVQIVALLTGDQEFDSAKTLSAFALGLVLFVVTLFFNVIAIRVVRKYREIYD